MESFIDDLINREDVVITRFPPEPNGYLHLGHAKSIHLNFEIAKKYNGLCFLRFDDTNPITEKSEYVDAIKDNLTWLGYTPDHIFHTSNYFDFMYEIALDLIRLGKAYVCPLTSEEIKEYMGTTDRPGKPSPNRYISVEENLRLFNSMRRGEIADGAMTLRAKIDMSSPNVHMRDPIIYRVKHVTHHNTSDKWCIYPMYDFAHPVSDYMEGVSHSICTMEFEVHRPLYDWVIEHVKMVVMDNLPQTPTQIEFSRLNLSHTVMSKRKLKTLVEDGIVDGWDDPRLPTLSGLRRRGVPSDAIKLFCDTIGVSRRENLIDMGVLENCTREVLNKTANRRMVVFDPIKVTITNWEGDEEWLSAITNPESDLPTVRMVNFGRNLLIEREDFMEDAPKGFFRLSVGKEVRFKYGYYVTCNEIIKNEKGDIIELLCTYDPETKGGWSDDGRKVKGTIHWINADNHLPISVNLYDRLFTTEIPSDDFLNEINPTSVITVNAGMEAAGPHGFDTHLQFERNGYYVLDKKAGGLLPVWNRTVSLKDSWKK
jgi:glutaminyl-tRNA synthetase